MKSILAGSSILALTLLFADTRAPAAEVPGSNVSVVAASPERSGRMLLKRSGISVEFSPGQEQLAEGVVDEALRWFEEHDRRVEAAAVAPSLPLGAADARARREFYLSQIAQEIGLSAPSELMQRCYDTMLSYYDVMGGLYELTGLAAQHVAKWRNYAIWKRSEVIKRLEAGEKIPGMSWDPVKQEGNFAFDYNFNFQPTEEEKRLKEEAERNRLNHSFNYKVKDGVAHIQASFTVGKKDFEKNSKGYVPSSYDPAQRRLRAQEYLKSMPEQVMPLILKDEDAPTLDSVLKQQRGITEWSARIVSQDYRNAHYTLVLLHETIEVGIIEHYIGSADRRWLCDGAANYLAWKIAQRHAGGDFASEVYNLDEQLRRHETSQKEIHLLKWAAVENQAKDEKVRALSEAHYPFATRAIAMMVLKHGEDIVAKLLTEVGKTPREKVRHKSVRAAYRKLTGDNLDSLLLEAARAKIPSKPTSVALSRNP